MFEGNLNTTNLLLGIMAVVSVLEGLVLIGIGVLGFRLYRQLMRTIQEIEERQIAPLAARVTALMTRLDSVVDDVKTLTDRLSRQTERVDSAIHHTMHRVDETAHHLRDSIESRISRLMGLVHGVTSVVQGLFTGRRSSTEAPAT